MIRLVIEEYCQSCLDFTPDVAKPQRSVDATGQWGYTDTIVTCEHCKRCAAIRRYLEQQMKGENRADA